MSRHMEIHSDNSYDCTKCHKKFSTKPSLYEHSKIHEEKKEIKCSQCNELFNSKSLLKKQY